MFKEFVSRLADDIVKLRISDPYQLLFLLDMTCEQLYEYHYDCYEILYPALLSFKEFLLSEEKEGGEE